MITFFPGYVLGLALSGQFEAAEFILGSDKPWWFVLTVCSMVGPIFTAFKIFRWSQNNWKSHPIAKALAVYCNNNSTWLNVASDVNIEFRR